MCDPITCRKQFGRYLFRGYLETGKNVLEIWMIVKGTVSWRSNRYFRNGRSKICVWGEMAIFFVYHREKNCFFGEIRWSYARIFSILFSPLKFCINVGWRGSFVHCLAEVWRLVVWFLLLFLIADIDETHFLLPQFTSLRFN